MMLRVYPVKLLLLVILTWTLRANTQYELKAENTQYELKAENADSNSERTSSKAQAVSFCNLARHPIDFDQKIVRVRAILVENHISTVDGGEAYLYDPRCYGKDYSMLFEESASPANYELDLGFRRLRGQIDEHGSSRVSIVALGVFDAPKGVRYGHLDRFRFRFVIRKIERAQSVAVHVPWPWQLKDDARVSRAEDAVKELNNQLVTFYAGGRHDIPANDLLTDNFSLNKLGHQTRNRDEFIEDVVKLPSFDGRIENSDVKVLVSRTSALVTGLITKSKDNVREEFRYKTKLTKQGKRWRVNSLEVVPE